MSAKVVPLRRKLETLIDRELVDRMLAMPFCNDFTAMSLNAPEALRAMVEKHAAAPAAQKDPEFRAFLRQIACLAYVLERKYFERWGELPPTPPPDELEPEHAQ